MEQTSILKNIDLAARLNGDTSSEWEVIRRDALKTFEEQGFPTRKDEDWRYLNFISLMKEPFQDPVEAELDSIAAWKMKEVKTNLVVFVNTLRSLTRRMVWLLASLKKPRSFRKT
jgi:Fe-S cluster assembly protein SufD